MLTSAVQVELFPLASIAVNVTVFCPIREQSNSAKSIYMVSNSHTSYDPLSIWLALIPTLPNTSNEIVMSWQRATGGVISSTVTVAVQDELLPFSSNTVSVTVFKPSMVQSNTDGSTAILSIKQLSVELSFMSVAEILTFPEASSGTVISWQLAIGATLSSTVTIAEQVLTLPFTSVTVKITVLAPTIVQSKVVWSKAKLWIPQLSVDALLISPGTTLAFPDPSNWIVISWHKAAGDTVSSTVTVAVHVLALPLASVTVKVTTFAPIILQSKAVWSNAKLWILQLSVEPLSISAALMLALPDPSNWIVISWHKAVGAIVSSTVTPAEQVPVLPLSSVTVKLTVLTPTIVQSKSVGSTIIVSITQLSNEPLLICAALILPFPLASNWIVMSWHKAVGSILSSTVIVAVQLVKFPSTSIKYKVSILVPKSSQVKSICDK